MRARVLASSLLLTFASLSVATPEVDARKRPVVSATVKKAKSHFKKGRDLQRLGQYEQAILEYQAAYQLAPRPELLFNIAQCHRLAGHASEAIDYYERFLAALPDDPAADEARIHVATLKQKEREALASTHVEPVAEKLPAPAPATTAPKVPPPKPAPPPRQQLIVTPTPTEVAHEDEARPPTLKWVGMGSVAAGVTLVGTGLWFGWRAAQTADEVDNASGLWTNALGDREQDALADQRRFYYLSGGGGALMIVGAALWWWGSDHGVQARPAVDHASTGLVVRGKF
jgi:tetratricopeptide (TPR) repeat protein